MIIGCDFHTCQPLPASLRLRQCKFFPSFSLTHDIIVLQLLVLCGNLAVGNVQRPQGKDMRSGTTTQLPKTAALLRAPLPCTLPPCHSLSQCPAERPLAPSFLATAMEPASSPIFKTRKCYNFRYNIARKSFKTKDRLTNSRCGTRTGIPARGFCTMPGQSETFRDTLCASLRLHRAYREKVSNRNTVANRNVV
jgi:hypothetical protein